MTQADVLRCESRFTADVINADRSAAEAAFAEDFAAVGFAANAVERAKYLAFLFAAERLVTVSATAEQKTTAHAAVTSGSRASGRKRRSDGE